VIFISVVVTCDSSSFIFLNCHRNILWFIYLLVTLCFVGEPLDC
jgi:hypothetical protein